MENISRDILKGWQVLVIEDDLSSLEVARYILAAFGANVLTATNGAEALKVLKNHKPRFILSDLSMPVMDGWQLIEELKKDRDLSGIPIFALTAHAMIGDREKALAAGFHNYMTKPFSVKTFIEQLMVLLQDFSEFNVE